MIYFLDKDNVTLAVGRVHPLVRKKVKLVEASNTELTRCYRILGWQPRVNENGEFFQEFCFVGHDAQTIAANF